MEYDNDTLDAVVAALIELRGETKWTSDAHMVTRAIKRVEKLRTPDKLHG